MALKIFILVLALCTLLTRVQQAPVGDPVYKINCDPSDFPLLVRRGEESAAANSNKASFLLRRSSLDNNFIRFGRSGTKLTKLPEEERLDNLKKSKVACRDQYFNFLRFGRSDPQFGAM